MAAKTPVVCIVEGKGAAATTRDLSEDDVIDLARSILAKRFCRNTAIGSPTELKEYLTLEFGRLEHEVFACLYLDTRHRIISFDVLFQGTINGTAVYPREVVKKALSHNAGAVIFVHNHPSGAAEPSRADELLTTRLKEALNLVDVRVLDHVIVAGCDMMSFSERGLL